MQTCTICGCRSISLNVNLNRVLPDTRLSSVENILDHRIKSRHGMLRFATKLGLTFGTARDTLPTVNLDLHPKPIWITLARKVLRSLSYRLKRATGAAISPTGVASILAKSTAFPLGKNTGSTMHSPSLPPHSATLRFIFRPMPDTITVYLK